MEKFEREHIQKNFSRLALYLNPSDDLINTLYTRRILNSAERGKLCANTNIKMKTNQLLTLLENKPGGYAALTDALAKAQPPQTKALEILKGGTPPPSPQTLLSPRHPQPMPTSVRPKITINKSALLGTGCCLTKVYEGTYGTVPVAVKVVNTEYFLSKDLLREIKQFTSLSPHPNVVRYYGYETDGDCIHIALERCDKTLEAWVKEKHPSHLSRMEILEQAMTGLEYLHSINIVHRDLKPENILLKGSVVKISDLGMSKKILEGSKHSVHDSSGVGTLGWIAPEILKWKNTKDERQTSGDDGRALFSKKSDIFSMGLVFYFVVTDGGHPFGMRVERDANIMKNKLQIVQKDVNYIGKEFKYVERMMAAAPDKRPSAEDLMKKMFGSKS